MLNQILEINQVLAVGSVDGILTTAALLRLIGKGNAVGLEFCQAFSVDRVRSANWDGYEKRVAFVDLAVNNRDPQMTRVLVQDIRDHGHSIVAVIDEHSREDWLGVIGVEIDEIDQMDNEDLVLGTKFFQGLMIEPQSQGAGPEAPKSSGEVLRRALVEARIDIDPHTLELLQAADAADRMDFTTRFGAIVNQAVKSAIADDSRRVYLARLLAFNSEPDEKVLGWMAEYEEILANHDLIVAAKTNLGFGIVRVSTVGRKVDMTTLMNRLYEDGAPIVICEGEMFNKALGKKTVQVAFGTNREKFNLLEYVKQVVPTASGFAQKANVDPEFEEVALAAVMRTFSGAVKEAP